MSVHDNGDRPPAFTPPAFVRQIDEKLSELWGKHARLKNKTESDNIAVIHQIGSVATSVLANNALISDLRSDVDAIASNLQTLMSMCREILARMDGK